MKLLSRSSISGDHRGIIEKMVQVECKLTGTEITHYWQDRCVFVLPFLSSNHCCERQKTKSKQKVQSQVQKAFSVLRLFSLFSSVGKTSDYFSLELIYSCLLNIRHFIKKRQRYKKLISRSALSSNRKLSVALFLPQE